jgi:endonuclease/exonuclease/phosphatase family metal-dependent hydrolase
VLRLALGTLLLVDVLRVWLPSIITIFGQAASTPAELMGAFALLWFLLPFAVVPLWRRLPYRARFTVIVVTAVGLCGSRAALVFVHGGQSQLYVASAGLLCGLVWFAAQAMDGALPVSGIPAGLVLAGMQHLALGTVDLTWTGTWWAAVVVGVEVLLFLLCGVSRPTDTDGAAAGGWSLVGPMMLLAGMVLLSPAALLVEVSYGTGHRSGTISIGEPVSAWLWPFFLVPVVAFYLGVTRLRDSRRGLSIAFGVALVLSVALYMYVPPHGWGPMVRIVAIWLGAWSLGRCVSLVSHRVTRPPAKAGAGLLAGMLVFAVAAVVYYAAYDIGYPNRWVPVVVAGYVAGRAIARAFEDVRVGQRDPAAWLSQAVLLVLAIVMYFVNPTSEPVEKTDAQSVRLVAYNIRMGFGLDGTFDPEAAARAVRRERPDVVVLSEVDRAWLLNGGHDTLDVLARKLGMRYLFAPAADPVWGDAVLTNLPVTARETVRLTADGAPTGAQALGVVVRVGGREIAVVSTHIQPPPGRKPLVQVREISAFATRFGGDRPTVVAGDLNIEPGDESMRAFDAAGYGDALAAFRPLRTFPADRPTKEIDHVLVRGGLTASEPSVGTTTASDHAPLAVTLRW